jgi:viroplasmin and RNaseH domain-containing protein
MKTPLPESINSIEEAKSFLSELHANGESFHPDDDAEDIILIETGLPAFTKEEAEQLNSLMDDIFWLNFDAFEYYLSII